MEQNNETKINSPKDGNTKQHLDFLTAIVILIVCAFAMVTSVGYWQGIGGELYASPGFMPIIICSALSFMAVLMMIGSLKNSSVKQRVQDLCIALQQTIRSKNVHRGLIGISMFGIYVFFMLGKMPFGIASSITLFALLMFLKFDKKLSTAIKLLIISALSVGGIILLFQVAFAVPMP